MLLLGRTINGETATHDTRWHAAGSAQCVGLHARGAGPHASRRASPDSYGRRGPVNVAAVRNEINGQIRAVPRGFMAAAAVMQGSRGGVDLPAKDIDRVKSHLAKYYDKLGESAPWD